MELASLPRTLQRHQTTVWVTFVFVERWWSVRCTRSMYKVRFPRKQKRRPNRCFRHYR